MNTPTLKIVEDLAEIPAAQWDALTEGDPFTSHAWLYALQASGCATEAQGWLPQHLTMWQPGNQDGDRLVAAMPLYVKMNSYGEHVFDFAWADAYQRNGLHYYPKLVCTVPFTPVSGRRLLALPDEQAAWHRGLLLGSALRFARDIGVSSLHCLFLDEAEAQLAANNGMMLRHDVQFHWHNAGYRDFEDYLAALSRDKRKRIRQDRRRVKDAGIELRCISGEDASEDDWAFFASCYAHTRVTHHSPPALNEDFFRRIGRDLPQHMLLVIAYRAGKPIASALDIVDGTTLYGRSWGSFEYHSGLHFEACFYQAIEYCIARGIVTFEGGAGGEHKLARGFLPVTTTSAHWLARPEFARAVEDYLQRETEAVAEYVDELQGHSPFRHG